MLRWTHNLLLVQASAAVGGGEGGGAGLAVPWHVSVLRAAADGQGVDAVGVAVTVAAILLPAAVTRCPHKDGAKPTTTLDGEKTKQTDTETERKERERERKRVLVPMPYLLFYVSLSMKPLFGAP